MATSESQMKCRKMWNFTPVCQDNQSTESIDAPPNISIIPYILEIPYGVIWQPVNPK